MRAATAGVLLAILALHPVVARAEETQASESEPVVVTATRTEQTLHESIRPVALIQQEEIAQSGQNTLTELLQARAGVEMAQSGGYGQPSSVFIRGANSSQTLVLLDGIRLNNAIDGRGPFQNLLASPFSRIEVVPGPLSSLYGSEAIGGVVQLFSQRWPEAPRAAASIGYGTYDTLNAVGGLSAAVGDTSFSANLSHLQSRGFSATRPGAPFGVFNPDNDAYRNTTFSGGVAHRLTGDDEIGARVFYTEGTTRFDAGPTTDDINQQRIGVYSAYARNRLADCWSSVVRVGVVEDSSTVTGAFPSVFGSEQIQLTWQNDLTTRAGTTIAGVEYLRQNASNATPFAVTHRDIYSAFAGHTAAFGDHSLAASVRYDSSTQFGDRVNGALGYAYLLTSSLRARASAGTAFHAPTFSDLYDPFSGNPDLQPEKSVSWEAGLDYTTGQHRLSATYFENNISGLIIFMAPTFTPQNIAKAQIKGAELGYDGVWLGVDVRARLTLQDPVDAETGKRLQRRAQAFGSVLLARDFGRWRAGAELVGSGDRYDSVDEDPATRLGAYTLLNLVASYRIDRAWRIEARWNNVLDQHYELVQGYNTPGSNLFVAVRYELK
jgi:vitamin B12 transporter